MARPSPDPAPAARPRKRRGRLFLLVLLILAAVPIVGVLVHAVVPPPMTILMAQQAIKGQGLDYRWRNLDAISPSLVRAVIASEDSTFCSHGGFDFKAIEQALEANKQGGRVRGGSTISQQTAKNVFLWPGRDWVRKGFEAGYTVLIEAVWTKRRIVEVYLNVAEWAPGVYGAEAASRHWFDKSAADLTPREAARLAAILPSPRRYNASSPGPYVRRRAGRVQAAARVVANEGLARCVTG
ncbi:monofunctional biosynthetic peptidoglycan transglycosylase [Brevundimonas variabilis]|uniref:Biosynthetic peptidoglycan transglycosylase n=1 Tax=Brevundimonas variabilis TaxID=74312 RepID=A0A7W9CFD4_9CAUL|nr:monofunctional biosynthetic peptidoglycan transglycosylase [Brevundimonas variabilis]MBB5744436.1 monofunctional biosynthetic peptidoglycan transglycosylase [Brevundimonas variabilis]